MNWIRARASPPGGRRRFSPSPAIDSPGVQPYNGGILLYIWGIKSLSLDDSSTEEAELAGDLSARVILLRFALLRLLLVFVSVSLTFVTALLSTKYNLGVSFA